MPDHVLLSTAPPPADADARSIGGKAFRLLTLCRSHPCIPRFLVLRAEMFDAFIATAGLSDWLAAEVAALRSAPDGEIAEIARRIQARVLEADLPAPMGETVERMCREFFEHPSPLAVRSSIVGEDSAAHSFAGIHDSVLGVRTPDELLRAVRAVWSSAFSARASTYRRHRGLAAAPIRPAVIVQELVPAVAAGVAFSRHPLAGRGDAILVESTWGLGADLVAGEVAGDRFLVDRRTLRVERELATKDRLLAYDPLRGGVERSDTPADRRDRSSLTDGQLADLARLVISIEARVGRAQDVEFCCDGAGRIRLLQARDVAPAPGIAARENHLVWDNANIAESYPGVTLPLTFSFIRRSYAIVYHCFAEIMGVAPSVIRANRRVYENLLGSIEGRVYYNLVNWYRALRLLPGFTHNRRFLEAMMGAAAPLVPDDRHDAPGWCRRWFVEFPALLRTTARSLWALSRVNRLTERFQRDFHRHSAEWERLDIGSMSPCRVRAEYERLEDALLWNWKAPIVGDFHLMIAYGLLKHACETWCGLAGLQTDLLRGMDDLESAAPAHHVLDLARLAADTPGLKELFLEHEARDLPGLVADRPPFVEFRRAFEAYVARYGFRCPEELKLESRSLRDEPERLYAILKNYLQVEKPGLYDSEAIKRRDSACRQAAERRAEEALSRLPGWFPRRIVFRLILKQARQGVRNREAMRFSRTRIFGLVREMFRSVGRSFAGSGLLDAPDDIFYLTVEEVWDSVKGAAVTTDLRGLVDVRRREYAAYRACTTPPANRFETYGVVSDGNHGRASAQPAGPPDRAHLLAGLGSCAGVVTGTVTCLHDPLDAEGVRGAIVAGQRLDAGWVTIFPLVRGLLMEHGNLLSHAAVVAREMGIPTIVSIPRLMSRLEDGMAVRMDGQAGTVEILSGPSA